MAHTKKIGPYLFTFTKWEGQRIYYWECEQNGKRIEGGQDVFYSLREAKLAAEEWASEKLAGLR